MPYNTTKFPIEANRSPVQVLAPVSAAVVSNAIGGSAALLVLPEYDVLEITVTTGCYMKMGDASVVADANCTILLPGTYMYSTRDVDFTVDPPTESHYSHMSIIQDSAAGKVSITPVV